MATIKSWLEKLKKAGNKVEANQLVKDIVFRNKHQIIELQQIQLDRGLDRHGELVGTYSEATAIRAQNALSPPNKSKTPGSHYNFDWTGAFIDGIYIKYNRGLITFHSRGMGGAEKIDFINRNELLGVSPDIAKIINEEIIKPQFVEAFKKKL